MHNDINLPLFKYFKDPLEANRFLMRKEDITVDAWNDTVSTDGFDESFTNESLTTCFPEKPTTKGFYGGKQRFQIPVSHSDIPSIFSQKANCVRMNAILGAARYSTRGKTPLTNKSGDKAMKQVPIKLPRTRSLLPRAPSSIEPEENSLTPSSFQKYNYSNDNTMDMIPICNEDMPKLSSSLGPLMDQDKCLLDMNSNSFSSNERPMHQVSSMFFSDSETTDHIQNMLNNDNSKSENPNNLNIPPCYMRTDSELGFDTTKPKALRRKYTRKLGDHLKHWFKLCKFNLSGNQNILKKQKKEILHGTTVTIELDAGVETGDQRSTLVLVDNTLPLISQQPRRYHSNNNSSKHKKNRGWEKFKQIFGSKCFGSNSGEQEEEAHKGNFKRGLRLLAYADGADGDQRSPTRPVPSPRHKNADHLQTVCREVETIVENMVYVTTFESDLKKLDYIADCRGRSPVFPLPTANEYNYELRGHKPSNFRKIACGDEEDKEKDTCIQPTHLETWSLPIYEESNGSTTQMGMRLVNIPVSLNEEKSVEFSNILTSSDSYLISIEIPSHESHASDRISETSSVPEVQINQVEEINWTQAPSGHDLTYNATQRLAVKGSGLWHLHSSSTPPTVSVSSEITQKPLEKYEEDAEVVDNQKNSKLATTEWPVIDPSTIIMGSDATDILNVKKETTLGDAPISKSEMECLAAFLRHSEDSQWFRSHSKMAVRNKCPNRNCRPNYCFHCQTRWGRSVVPQIRGRINHFIWPNNETQSNLSMEGQPFVPYCFSRLAELKASRSTTRSFHDVMSFNGSNQTYTCDSAYWLNPKKLANHWKLNKPKCCCSDSYASIRPHVNEVDRNRRVGFQKMEIDSSSESSNFYCSSPSELSFEDKEAVIIDNTWQYNEEVNHNKCGTKCEYCSVCCKRILSGTYAGWTHLRNPQRIAPRPSCPPNIPTSRTTCCENNKESRKPISGPLFHLKPRSCLMMECEKVKPCNNFTHLDKCCENKQLRELTNKPPWHFCNSLNAPKPHGYCEKQKEKSCATFNLGDGKCQMVCKLYSEPKQLRKTKKRVAMPVYKPNCRGPIHPVDCNEAKNQPTKRFAKDNSKDVIYWVTEPQNSSKKCVHCCCELKENTKKKPSQPQKPKWCGPFNRPTTANPKTPKLRVKLISKKGDTKEGKGMAAPVRPKGPSSNLGNHIRKTARVTPTPPPLTKSPPIQPNPTKCCISPQDSEMSLQCSCSQISLSTSLLCSCSPSASSLPSSPSDANSKVTGKLGVSSSQYVANDMNTGSSLVCCCPVDVATQTHQRPRIVSAEPRYQTYGRYKSLPSVNNSKR